MFHAVARNLRFLGARQTESGDRVRIPVRLETTGWTGVFTNPQRFFRRNATRRALFSPPSGVNGDEERSFPFAVVFEQREGRFSTRQMLYCGC